MKEFFLLLRPGFQIFGALRCVAAPVRTKKIFSAPAPHRTAPEKKKLGPGTAPHRTRRKKIRHQSAPIEFFRGQIRKKIFHFFSKILAIFELCSQSLVDVHN